MRQRSLLPRHLGCERQVDAACLTVGYRVFVCDNMAFHGDYTRGTTFPNRRESSNPTRTYNPPVNSCTDGKTANYRQLRLILKIRLLRHFQERLSTANSEGDSLKKSPKYFPASPSTNARHFAGFRCGPAQQRSAQPQDNNAPCP